MNEPKLIPLRDRDGNARAYAIVDAADFGSLSQWRWCLSGPYAHRRKRINGGRLKIYMHRQILGLEPGDGIEADHVNGNKLDNRRENLRAGSHAVNGQNIFRAQGTSEHRGVSWDAQRGSWRAQAMVAGKNHLIGRFATEREAADAATAFRRRHMPFAVEEDIA